jgi:ribosomal protein L3
MVTGQARFAGNATGGRGILVDVGGTPVAGSGVFTTNVNTIVTASASTIIQLAVNDVVTLRAYQNSGGNLAYTVGANNIWLAFAMLSQD